jgi:hypothetical protein
LVDLGHLAAALIFSFDKPSGFIQNSKNLQQAFLLIEPINIKLGFYIYIVNGRQSVIRQQLYSRVAKSIGEFDDARRYLQDASTFFDLKSEIIPVNYILLELNILNFLCRDGNTLNYEKMYDPKNLLKNLLEFENCIFYIASLQDTTDEVFSKRQIIIEHLRKSTVNYKIEDPSVSNIINNFLNISDDSSIYIMSIYIYLYSKRYLLQMSTSVENLKLLCNIACHIQEQTPHNYISLRCQKFLIAVLCKHLHILDCTNLPIPLATLIGNIAILDFCEGILDSEHELIIKDKITNTSSIPSEWILFEQAEIAFLKKENSRAEEILQSLLHSSAKSPVTTRLSYKMPSFTKVSALETSVLCDWATSSTSNFTVKLELKDPLNLL